MDSLRVKPLNTQGGVDGNCVVYVMSRDQRVADNFALVAAQKHALKQKLPLVVLFVLRANVGFRRREHYQFMLAGLDQVRSKLMSLNIGFVVLFGPVNEVLQEFAQRHSPVATYFDFNPLPGVRQAQKAYANLAKESCFVVDAHNIIPAWVTSNKQEFAAYTIRPKIHKLLPTYLVEPEQAINHPYEFTQSTAPKDITALYASVLKTVKPAGITIGTTAGEAAAHKHVQNFIKKLPHYANGRNDIANDMQSGLSPYLHFGQIASLRVALDVMQSINKEPHLFNVAKMPSAQEPATAEDGMNALFEEMIVRKELSDNYCLYTNDVQTIDNVAQWAKDTLRSHASDAREYTYSDSEWENALTHDPAWNAAQRQLRSTGKMHGYMRMYWAKKILEWSESPEHALKTAIYLNDTYSVDGGDPNGYVGILWSIAGLHDRAWTERPVYGTIRYMNQAGLRRKFDLDTYVHQWMS